MLPRAGLASLESCNARSDTFPSYGLEGRKEQGHWALNGVVEPRGRKRMEGSFPKWLCAAGTMGSRVLKRQAVAQQPAPPPVLLKE